MIKVNVLKDDHVINEVIISGHAMYDVIGKDIVCSAVSSIVITSINGILSLDDKALLYEQKEDKLIVKILKHDQNTDKLINNMINLLKELEKDYKNNINVI